MSTVGGNIDEMERLLADYVGVKYAVGLTCGTVALHFAIRLAGERLYGARRAEVGTLAGHKMFCSDMTVDATVNPVTYEGGEAVFIDTEYDTWNMDPVALEIVSLFKIVYIIMHISINMVVNLFLLRSNDGKRRECHKENRLLRVIVYKQDRE